MLDGRPIIKIVVKAEVSNRNDGQGRHWSASSKARTRLFDACRDAEFYRWNFDADDWELSDLKSCKIPSRQKVDILATRVLGPKRRMWDPDSILRGEFKQLLDSLVQLRVIEDDSSKYVGYVVGDQDPSRRHDGDSFELTFYEA